MIIKIIHMGKILNKIRVISPIFARIVFISIQYLARRASDDRSVDLFVQKRKTSHRSRQWLCVPEDHGMLYMDSPLPVMQHMNSN